MSVSPLETDQPIGWTENAHQFLDRMVERHDLVGVLPDIFHHRGWQAMAASIAGSAPER